MSFTNRSSSRTLAIAAAISFFIAGIASAQQPQKLRDRDPDLAASKEIYADLERATARYGPWYLLSRIQLSDAGFTEGGYLPTGESDGAVSLGIEAPTRLYFVPHKKTIFTVEASPGFSFFGKERNQFNYAARADAHFLLNHLYLDVYTTAIDQLRAHVSDFNRLATLQETTSGMAGEWKYSSRTSALFHVSYRESEYPADRYQPRQEEDVPVPVDLLERAERNGRVSLTHKTFPRTTLFVAAETSNYGFRNAPYKDSNRTLFSAGVQWGGARTQIRAEAGPASLDFESPTERDFTGLTGQVSVARSNGPWSMTLSADRDLGFAITRNNNYYIASTVSAALSRQTGRRLTLRANATRERDDYDRSVVIDGTSIDRQDTISYYGAGAIYGLRSVRFGADIGWYERTSTLLTERDSGIRYVVHLTVGHNLWRKR